MENVDNIKTSLGEMTTFRQWVCWKKGPPKGNGKFNKIPVNPNTGERLKGPHGGKEFLEQAGTFEEAIEGLSRLPGGGGGLGFVLSKEDPFVGVDLDNCLGEGNEPEDIVDAFGSYCEVSPSGKGLRIFCKGELPEGARKVNGDFEIYDCQRFMTVTGDPWKYERPLAPAQDAITGFCRNTIGIDSPHDLQGGELACYSPQTLEEIKSDLQWLSPDIEYDNWLKVGQALHYGWPDEDGFQAWEDWSAKGEKFAENAQGEMLKKWEGFSASKANSVKPGTIFWLVDKYGTKPPSKAPLEKTSRSCVPELMPHENQSKSAVKIWNMPYYMQWIISMLADRRNISQEALANTAIEKGLIWLYFKLPHIKEIQRLKHEIAEKSASPEMHMKIFQRNNIDLQDLNCDKSPKMFRLLSDLQKQVEHIADVLGIQQGKLYCLTMMTYFLTLEEDELDNERWKEAMLYDLRNLKQIVGKIRDEAQAIASRGVLQGGGRRRTKLSIEDF